MIKVIVHVTKAVLVVLAALTFFSCDFVSNFKSVEGSGNVVTKERKLSGDFKSVSSSGGIEVLIEQGDGKMVTVEADDNLHEVIKTEVEDGTLKIHAEGDIRNAASKKVIVRLPVIEGLESGGGTTMTSRNTLKGDGMNLSASSGSHMTVTVDTKNLSCESSSGSHLKVSGTANNLQTESSSGSTLNAKSLAAQMVTAEASSGSTTMIDPKDGLSADASSGGKIYYAKTPGKLDKKTSSGGSVAQE